MSLKLDGDGNPIITLGGKDFSIPLMAARQNRVIDPIIIRLLPIFVNLTTTKGTSISEIGDKEYIELQELVYVALTRKNPALTRDQFLDMPITLSELVEALPVICQQTGIFKKTDDSPAAPQGFDIPGEAQAGNDKQ